jgi:hypothetical protein
VSSRLSAAIALAILLPLAATGCGGSESKPTHSVDQAQGFTDGFVHKLVVVGKWKPVEADVAPSFTRQVRQFQTTIRRNGFRRVAGPGQLRHDCPDTEAIGAGKDCFVYRITGQQVIPIAGVKTIAARYRVWVSYTDGRWQVINYDYDLLKQRVG